MFKKMRFQVSVVITLSIILLSACQSDKQNKETDLKTNDVKTSETAISTEQKIAALRKFEAASDKKIVQAAFLNDHLPESAFAYARIPNLWSFFGTAKGNIFDTALNAKPFFDSLNGIKNGFNENIIPDISDENIQIITRLILKNLTSPIEAIAITGVDPAVPTPNLVISAAVDFKSVDEIQKTLETLAEKAPEIEIKKAMQADGYAELNIAKMSTQLQWNKEQSRITLLLGLSLSPNNLTDTIKTFVANPDHPMKVTEKTIDTSGQGFFLWANPRELARVSGAVGMQNQIAPLAVMGVNSMKSIAIGEGSSGGIKRLKYVIEMPVTGFRSYMPIVKTSPDFDVMGETNLVATLGLPSTAGFAAIENTIALVSKEKDMKDYYEFKKKFNESLGFRVDDIFEFFGQDINLVSDEAGTYAAVRLNNAEKFKNTLENSVKNLNLEYRQREIGGHIYHHLKIPSLYTQNPEEKAAKKSAIPENKLLDRFLSLPSDFYWEEEGDYLILSDIPQTLIDRHYIKTKTPVKDWLKQQQRIEPEGSLLMVSVRNKGVAKKMYRMHLSSLNLLADFAGKPIDLFDLATPIEANIPEENSYGLKVTSSETHLAFELNYESNPYEFLLAGSAYQGVAVVGILASVALPAYQDYTVRAAVVEGYSKATQVQYELDEFEIKNGRYPNEAEIKAKGFDKRHGKYSIKVEANTGEIKLKINNIKLRSYNKDISLVPPKQGVSIRWTCKTKMLHKYRPIQCRNNYDSRRR